ncbi:MAG: TetR/AcrR family transcriptional regulator [Burkholderiales bacterium]|nr:TetR/AcrR family transcriptional regulator [Burkholderiales bacterium]
MRPPKQRRDTRKLILDAALRLFNEIGEPDATTNHIAEALDISPGNLYYHFHSKQDIARALFDRFAARAGQLAAVPVTGHANVEDLWFLLHSLFEEISAYRFLFRDLHHLLRRDPALRRDFERLLERIERAIAALCRNLAGTGAMHATEREIDVLAEQLTFILTSWLGYRSLLGMPRSGGESQAPARGAHQALALAAQYFDPPGRKLLDNLAGGYLDRAWDAYNAAAL